MPTITIDDETMAMLERHAATSGQSTEAILNMAVADFNASQPDIATAVEKARLQVAAGATVSHAEVIRELQAMGLDVG